MRFDYYLHRSVGPIGDYFGEVGPKVKVNPLFWLLMKRLGYRATRTPRIGTCPESENGKHLWQHGWDWNSGKRSKFTGDYIGRKGHRCFHCGEMVWDHTDMEFHDKIKDIVLIGRIDG